MTVLDYWLADVAKSIETEMNLSHLLARGIYEENEEQIYLAWIEGLTPREAAKVIYIRHKLSAIENQIPKEEIWQSSELTPLQS